MPSYEYIRLFGIGRKRSGTFIFNGLDDPAMTIPAGSWVDMPWALRTPNGGGDNPLAEVFDLTDPTSPALVLDALVQVDATWFIRDAVTGDGKAMQLELDIDSDGEDGCQFNTVPLLPIPGAGSIAGAVSLSFLCPKGGVLYAGLIHNLDDAMVNWSFQACVTVEPI